MSRKLIPRPAWVSIALVFLGAAASAETRTVETSVEVAAAPERVLAAFVDGDELHGWWKVSRSLVHPEPGGVWSVVWDDYGEDRTQHTWVGVVAAHTPRRLEIDHLVMIEPGRPLFGPLQLEIVARPTAEGTLLTVYHRGYLSGADWDWIHDTVVAGWRHVLTDLQRWFERPAQAAPRAQAVETIP